MEKEGGQAVIQFNPENHTFTLNGKDVPGVTRVLKDERWIDTRFFAEEGRERGTNVHKATAFLDADLLDWRTVDPAIVGYVESWEKARNELGLKITGIERIVYKGELYAGIVDREALWDKRKTVIDLKTGSPNRADNLQIVAYGATYRTMPRLLLVYLKPDGYKAVELEPDVAEVYSMSWFHIVSLWHFRRRTE
jgi:hypothetical protein